MKPWRQLRLDQRSEECLSSSHNKGKVGVGNGNENENVDMVDVKVDVGETRCQDQRYQGG